LLGAGGNGLYSWQIGDERAELSWTLAGSAALAGSPRARHFQDYARVGGISLGTAAFSSSVRGVSHGHGSGISYPKNLEIVGDLDRRNGLTAMVGLSRKPDGDWENLVSWLILDDGTVHGLLPRRTQTSHWLLALGLGVVRILPEQQVLIIPGLEPGVFVYEWSGELRDTVETDALFAESPWKIDPGQKELLTEPSWYTAWLSRHRVIDEVVADGRGNVYFFVRHVATDLPWPKTEPGSASQVSGGLTYVDGSGQVRRQTFTEEQAARVVELLKRTGETTDEGELVLGQGPISADLEEFMRILAEPEAEPDGGSGATRADQRTRVCWDLVYAHIDDLRTATKAACAVESEFADARLRADLRGDRAAILLTVDTYIVTPETLQARRSELFEARLIPPGD